MLGHHIAGGLTAHLERLEAQHGNDTRRHRGVHGYEREGPEAGLSDIPKHAGERDSRDMHVSGNSQAWTHARGDGEPSPKKNQAKPAAYASASPGLALSHQQRTKPTGMTAGIRIAEVNGALEVVRVEIGGPAAITRQICTGDIVMSVDPGEEFLKVHWHWQQQVAHQQGCCLHTMTWSLQFADGMVVQGDRRWIDVRGWKEKELHELIELNQGQVIWFRMRRKDVEFVSRVCLREKDSTSTSTLPGMVRPCTAGERAGESFASDCRLEESACQAVSLVVAGRRRVQVPLAMAGHLRRSSSIDLLDSHRPREDCCASWVHFRENSTESSAFEFEILACDKASFALCTPGNVREVLGMCSCICVCAFAPQPMRSNGALSHSDHDAESSGQGLNLLLSMRQSV